MQDGIIYVVLLVVPATALKISDEANVHDITGDTGHTVSRRFCPNCNPDYLACPRQRQKSRQSWPEELGRSNAIPSDDQYLWRKRTTLGSHESRVAKISKITR
jgi:hypothetical protein